MIAAGAPLAIAGPLAFAIILSLMGWAYDWGFSYFIVWLLVGFALFGTLAWKVMERATSEDLFADDMLKLVSLQPEDSTNDATLEDIVGQEPKAALRILLGPLARGPERLFRAWQLAQARKRLTPQEQQRAAEVIRDLSTYSTGIPWLDLKNADETVQQLLHVLGYLKATDWISVANEGHKVWLISDARKAASVGGLR
jgi:hypothetical protein